MVLLSRTMGAAYMGSMGPASSPVGANISEEGSDDNGTIVLGSRGCENRSSCCGVGNVGVCTISPHSSSSSTGILVVSMSGAGKLSGLSSIPGRIRISAEGCTPGEMWFATLFVSEAVCDTVAVRLCIACSDLRGVRSTDTARSSCRCSLATMGFFGASGADVDRCDGLSSFQWSVDAEELQLKAADWFEASGGRLCLAGRAVFVAGTEDCVRE